MKLDWTDTLEIAEQLCEAHADVDPLTVRFTDLQQWILALPDFAGERERCNERILEAVQMAWIDEKD